MTIACCFVGLALAAPIGDAAAAAAVSPTRSPDLIGLAVEYHALELALLALSVVVVGLTLERVYTLFLGREAILPSATLTLVRKLTGGRRLDDADRDELLRTCRSNPGAYSTVVEQCARRAGDLFAHIVAVGKEAYQSEYEKVDQLTGVLFWVAVIAPFLGLLGTVSGMIVAFHQAGGGDAARPLLAKGLSAALHATAGGILVALVAVSAARLMRWRLKSLFKQMAPSLTALAAVLASEPSR